MKKYTYDIVSVETPKSIRLSTNAMKAVAYEPMVDYLNCPDPVKLQTKVNGKIFSPGLNQNGITWLAGPILINEIKLCKVTENVNLSGMVVLIY